MDVFEAASAVRDEKEQICQFNHIDEPYRLNAEAARAVSVAEDAAQKFSAKMIADAYLKDALPHYGLDCSLVPESPNAVGSTSRERDSLESHKDGTLEFDNEKSVMGNSRVTYNQTFHGVPVWESGVVVQVEDALLQVIGSQSSVHRSPDIATPNYSARFRPNQINEASIRSIIGLPQQASLKVGTAHDFIYRFVAANRVEHHHEGPAGECISSIPFALVPVSESIIDQNHYYVSAVELTVKIPKYPTTSWLVLIEQESGSILLLKSLEGCAGKVITESSSQTPTSANAHFGDRPKKPSVVYFDIGDTLGKGVFSGSGSLIRIDIFPEAFEVVKELSENGTRVGVISDPGSINPDIIVSLLQDTGILRWLNRELLVFGRKNSTDIFEQAAQLADVNGDECLFVGEDMSERQFAEAAGFVVSADPRSAVSLVDPNAALAWVYLTDPITKLGSAGSRPTASEADLNSHRDLVSLKGLTRVPPGNSQELDGEYIRLVNITPPDPPMPSSPAPVDFRSSVNTDDFGAVNAYHNCDRLFRILEGFGIDVRAYFDGTTFPVRVDHRVQYEVEPGVFSPNVVNASAPGFRFPPRSDGFRFALTAKDTSVGMACDWRVVLHEFGHTLLWDNVGSPNFHFAHGPGDALAAILNDPGNRAPLGLTFPWVAINRSHLRPVSDFAWYGTRYNPFVNGGTDRAGYVAEQMLSSTLFRIYQAAGGDSADHHSQEFAAAYVAFLIIKSIGLMSPANNPPRPEGYADLMMQADTGAFQYHGGERVIGALRKVIRWAFEMQGAYRQPPTGGQMPTNQIGNPPQVDVFINDGRGGHYGYVETIESADIWNRNVADNGAVHQAPVIGRDNFVYVRVANRGTAQATSVEVRAFQSPTVADQVWPNDWTPLADAILDRPSPIASGNAEILGPFRWNPLSIHSRIMMAVSASGDQSNLSRFSSANPVDTSILVRLDNNIAIRTMLAVSDPSPTPGPVPVV
jgi:hypothetical protein